MRNSLCVLVVTTLAAIPATSQSQLPKAIEWHIGSALEAKLAPARPAR